MDGVGKDEAHLGVPASLGLALRERRIANGVSIRELANQAGVSASLVSQIETGKINPSVGRLLSLVTALGLSLDELFVDVEGRDDDGSAGPEAGDGRRPGGERAVRVDSADLGIVSEDARRRVDLATGVHWHRLTPHHEQGVDFLYVVYEVGGASCPPDALMRHSGREYGLVLSGRLGATVGFDDHELGPGDSIVFNSDVPHRLWAIGDEPVTGVWTIIGRGGDQRES